MVVFLLRWAVTGTRMSQSVATCEPRRHKHASFKMNWVICKICACVSWTNGNILRLLCLPMRLSHAMPQALMGPSKRHPSRPNGCNHNHCYKLSPTSCIERLGSSLWPSEAQPSALSDFLPLCCPKSSRRLAGVSEHQMCRCLPPLQSAFACLFPALPIQCF